MVFFSKNHVFFQLSPEFFLRCLYDMSSLILYTWTKLGPDFKCVLNSNSRCYHEGIFTMLLAFKKIHLKYIIPHNFISFTQWIEELKTKTAEEFFLYMRIII
jgi:hypothetical protein